MLKDMHFTIRLRWQGYLAGMRKECRYKRIKKKLNQKEWRFCTHL